LIVEKVRGGGWVGVWAWGRVWGVGLWLGLGGGKAGGFSAFGVRAGGILGWRLKVKLGCSEGRLRLRVIQRRQMVMRMMVMMRVCAVIAPIASVSSWLLFLFVVEESVLLEVLVNTHLRKAV